MKKTVKSIFSVLLCLVLLIGTGITGLNVYAADSGKCGDGVSWKFDSNGTLTISGTGAMKNYSEESKAPWRSKKIKSVVIKSGVTSIGNDAFAVTSLTKITIPDTVESIGRYAFYNCSKLTGVTIPEKVTCIDYYSFAECTGLKEVTLPGGLTEIGTSAFSGCTSLAAAAIPESVEVIGNDAFFDCKALTEITVPANVKSVSTFAFKGCTKLANATILTGAESIESFAFYECTNLKSVTFPKTVKSIKSAAFGKCDSLTDVYYSGSKINRDRIEIGTVNEPLLNAEWHYNTKIAGSNEGFFKSIISRIKDFFASIGDLLLKLLTIGSAVTETV